jgi:type 2 lantibiotic biosynthesis protein LanM
MTSDDFHVPAWFLANTLAERVAARRRVGRTSQAPANKPRAEARLKRWQDQIPFRDSDFFQQRLAADQITEEELLDLLGEPAEAVAVHADFPTWLAELESAFAGCTSWPSAELPAERAEGMGFLDLVAPLLARGRQRVRAGVRALAERATPFDPGTVEEILVGNLPDQLHRMLARTLVLELNVARLRGQLTGETPEERFASFVYLLKQADTVLPILREYPVLARQVVQCIDRWAAFSLEFLGHLCADWPAILNLLPGGDPGPLVGIQASAGDTHRGGRAVLIATFQSGDRVVYKPKALAVDRHFQELLAWVNARAAGLPPFRTLGIVDRGTYGWVEFIEAKGCDNEEEVRRFYQRQGGYLALLYALEATDFHSENLIAAGEHPVLLDLEALFHPRSARQEGTRALEVANAVLNFSVLRVGLLPRLIWASDESAGIDVSGLGATGGQLSPHRVALLEGSGTDSMRLVRERVELVRDANRPTLGEADVELARYGDDIVAGFEIVYRLLQAHREELLAPDGAVDAFAGDEIRVIIRETRTYSVLLQESFHPDLLRDALDRDRLFDRMWVGITGYPDLARVIPAERDDLLQGDIPLFTTRPAARDLWTSSSERLPDFFAESGLGLVEKRFRGLDEDDLARQRWIIRASLATTIRSGALPSDSSPMPPSTSASRDALLAAAVAVGDRLGALALRAGSGASWLGLNLLGQGRWFLSPLGSDLYNGLPGVALFLAYLGRVTGEKRHTELAEAATTTLRQQAAPGQDLGNTIGLDGWGGLIYALAHLGALWDRPSLLAGAKMIVTALPDLIDKDDALDILSGTAGCLGGLLCLHRVAPSEATRAAAVRAGVRLLGRAQPAAQGLNWPPSVPASAPLTGFGRGAAGVAWALLELATVTGDERFRQLATQAITYERSVFSPEAGNWPDFRLPEDGTPGDPGAQLRFSLSWAHGAPGIGLARLQALRHLDDPALRGEIDATLAATLAGGVAHNHSLGHGDLGNLELLLEASRVLGESRWQAEAARLAGGVLESIRRDGWQCATPQAVETPGLMGGLAGIGLGFLRLAEPDKVPSVLVLAPPALN